MSKLNDGGQAFPNAVSIGPMGDVYPAYPGMTLRDWLAGQALAGILANNARLQIIVSPSMTQPEADAAVARAAYASADAVLVEREK